MPIHPRHRKYYRLVGIIATLITLAVAVTVLLNTFEDAVVFYYTPQEIQAKGFPLHKKMRIGGLVEEGSLQKTIDPSHNLPQVTFTVTDKVYKIQVHYQGPLPDLFKEGQGVVAEGMLETSELFKAKTILAKHDEYYRPPTVSEKPSN